MDDSNVSASRVTKEGARAVLWDMDGTLIDSSEQHWLAWRDTLAARNLAVTYEQFAATFGQRNDDILRGHFGPDLPAEEIARIGEAKENVYRELVRARGVELLPGVREWLDRLKSAGWLQAIASSAPRRNLEVIVEVLGAEGYFAAIASAEDVTRGKPDPQVFLAAAGKLGVPAARCVVVEDAPAGIEAARRAGMRSVGVLSSHGALEADVVVRTLEELPDATFDQLLARG
jgi:beta-phosphoglucomutase